HHCRLPEDVPNDLEEIPRPRAIYMGSITRVLDFTLLRDVARLLPDVSFVFVGAARLIDQAIRPVFEEWADCPNVYQLGQKPASVLPFYLQESDVALLPYLITEDTKERYPLKLHEYMAAGKPVVSAPLSCVREFSPLVTQATTAEEWAGAIRANLREADSDTIDERRRAARRHDWNRVVMKLESLLGQAMSSTGADSR
ncbi:MAG: glycosyltransferase, partial [Gemmatimonadetes bacterium]|nr:glycosyltransferase [Gemmatimonadota bacterium]